jgi:hypothetical protein
MYDEQMVILLIFTGRGGNFIGGIVEYGWNTPAHKDP